MAAGATFDEFDAYRLDGVTVTDRELGHGSYATVLELEYMGLKCAGKKIHEVLLRQGGASYTVRRFEEECRLLSQVHHPNIVQFLGVHFQQNVTAPILVMEFLPTNLTSCIEQYGILPKEICYSILHDVALGLCYLHSQQPPIIHRDLSVNNVLLTPNMTAKISDLGVARLLNLTPLQVSRMTQTPGTPAYMPPEVMIANPKYDTSVDEFSYGILMIHMLSGRWPEPQVGPTEVKDGQLVPVTEAERREVFLRAIGNDHPLIDLITKCINNDPKCRAHAPDIVERTAAMKLQFPASFPNQLEILQYVDQLQEEKQALKEEAEAQNQQKNEQILTLQNKAEEKEEENTRLNLVYSSEVEQLKLQVRDLNANNQQLTATKEADVAEMTSKIAMYEKQVEDNGKIIQQLREQYESHQENYRKKFEIENFRQKKEFEMQMAREKEELTLQLTSERESCERLKNENQHLEAEVSQSVTNTVTLKHTISTLEAEASRNRATLEKNESELETKTRALEEKQAVSSGMSEQLTRAREHLTSKQQVVQASITRKQCADLPNGLNYAKTIVINNKVYYGGGMAQDDDDSIIYCYDLTEDNWTPLPPLSVTMCGIGQVSGKLVAIGGIKISDNDSISNDIFTFDEKSSKWERIIPPMSTARYFPGVLSLKSALIVTGGAISKKDCTNVVEIFKEDTSQWYSTDPLPKSRANISVSLVAIDNTCYVLGGFDFSVSNCFANQAFYASVDDILHNAIPSNQISKGVSVDIQSAWKALPHTPMYSPVAAVLADKLLAIGGANTTEYDDNEEDKDDKDKDNSASEDKDMYAKIEIYIFSASTNSWIYFGDLPEPQYLAAVAVLSSTEILVIGGVDNETGVKTTYKGTLQLRL